MKDKAKNTVTQVSRYRTKKYVTNVYMYRMKKGRNTSFVEHSEKAETQDSLFTHFKYECYYSNCNELCYHSNKKRSTHYLCIKFDRLDILGGGTMFLWKQKKRT